MAVTVGTVMLRVHCTEGLCESCTALIVAACVNAKMELY